MWVKSEIHGGARGVYLTYKETWAIARGTFILACALYLRYNNCINATIIEHEGLPVCWYHRQAWQVSCLCVDFLMCKCTPSPDPFLASWSGWQWASLVLRHVDIDIRIVLTTCMSICWYWRCVSFIVVGWYVWLLICNCRCGMYPLTVDWLYVGLYV